MPESDPSTTDTSLHPGEVERAVLRGGAVVQLVTGEPADGDATVVEVHPATVIVTSERLLAVDGDLEWSWLLDDIEGVHHGRNEPWTLVAVPGVDDHGVSVQVADVLTFRRALAAALEAEAARAGAAGSRARRPAGRGAGDRAPHTDPRHPRRRRVPAPEDEPHRGLPMGAAAAGLVTVADLRHGEDEVQAVVTEPDPTVEVDLTEGSFPPPPPPPLVADDEASPEASSSTKKSRFRGGAERRAEERAAADQLPLAGLEAREISAWFGTHHVLDRVSLMMEPGEVTALIGPSGCGKSTFLRILNRMHEMIAVASLSGEVLLDGEDIYDAQKKLDRGPSPDRHGVPEAEPVPGDVDLRQRRGLLQAHRHQDLVRREGRGRRGVPHQGRALDRGPRPPRAPGGGLSGGQQQRLCIARALAIRPRVLLMDEPCSALDPTSTRRIEETIMELGSEVTIVIVTHNMQQAARVSDQCAFFLAEQGTPGVIVEHGPTDAMFHSPQDPRTYDYVNGRFG